MKCNIVIGLGGTGGRAIRALRKRIWQDNGSNDIPGLFLDYLYVDSSREMMDPLDKSWIVAGENVQLSQASQLQIGGGNVRQILEAPNTHPTIAPWIGSPEQWKKVPEQVISAGAGGQRRRLGRFLFAMQAANFKSRLHTLRQTLFTDSKQGVCHYHIITGTAGGTGGGSFLDVLSYLSSDPELIGSKVSLFAVMPERGTQWNAGNYYANGYAALKELNGALIGKYQPTSLFQTRAASRFDLERIKGVYLVSNENAAGVRLDVGNDVPAMVADFLYERLLEAGTGDGEPPVTTCENSDFSPEMVVGTQDAQRSRRFMSFGIKRVEYPEARIAVDLSSQLSNTACLQLEFNNWQDEFGYVELAANTNYSDKLQDDERLERWRLTNDHLTGAVGILEQDIAFLANWNTSFASEWSAPQSHYSAECAKLERARMLPDFSDYMDEEFHRGFRGQGVPQYFALRREARSTLARQVVDLIEADFWKDLREGNAGGSFHDTTEMIKGLIVSLENRRKDFEGDAQALREKIKAQQEDIDEAAAHAARVMAPLWIVQKTGILQRFALLVGDMMVARTELEGTNFAIDLIPAIIDELRGLQTILGHIREILSQAKKDLQSAIADSEQNKDRDVTEAYDKEAVQRVKKRMLLKKDEMTRIAAEIRHQLFDTPKLTNTRRFNALYNDLLREPLSQILIRKCRTEVKPVHDALKLNEPEKVLGIALMDRLETEFGGKNEAFQTFARETIDHAAAFVRIDQVELIREAETVGAAGEDRMKSHVVVQRPSPPERQAFVDRLDAAMKGHRGDVEISKLPTSRPNTLTVMEVQSGMPARYFEIARFLKDKYQERLATTAELTQLEVHTEDGALDLPDIFPETGAPIKALPYLLVGWALDCIREEKNPGTGRSEVLMATLDKFGMEDLQPLARSWSDLPDALSPKSFLTLKESVDSKVKHKDLSHIDARQAVLEKVKGRVREVAEKEGQRSERYEIHRKALNLASAILALEE